jgi:two-component system, chemotaxis family, protein-glutamate methylesterase/glutaminase
MITIGASWGGLKAVQILLAGLPPAFPMPLAVVLHRHRETDDLLSAVLQKHSPLPVIEAVDKMPIQSGCVFVAPADYHLLVEPVYFSLSTDEPVQHARPSIDVLFESAADVFGAMVIGVVLTGASQDGARGAAQIQRRGGTVIVQDPATAASSIMPAAALAATQTPFIQPLHQIAAMLIQMTESQTMGQS